jgi:hypothetical protein
MANTPRKNGFRILLGAAIGAVVLSGLCEGLRFVIPAHAETRPRPGPTTTQTQTGNGNCQNAHQSGGIGCNYGQVYQAPVTIKQAPKIYYVKPYDPRAIGSDRIIIEDEPHKVLPNGYYQFPVSLKNTSPVPLDFAEMNFEQFDANQKLTDSQVDQFMSEVRSKLHPVVPIPTARNQLVQLEPQIPVVYTDEQKKYAPSELVMFTSGAWIHYHMVVVRYIIPLPGENRYFYYAEHCSLLTKEFGGYELCNAHNFSKHRGEKIPPFLSQLRTAN